MQQTVDHPIVTSEESARIYLQWTPVFAGATVAAALAVILATFGSAIGLSVTSSTPTWRDASPALVLLSGLFLLLAAVASFGLGGYVAGRVRETWVSSAHDDIVEFRDGTHGAVAWAVAIVISGVLAAATATAITSKNAPASASSVVNTGEALFPYELDRLFRADRRGEGDLTYSRAEAGRILLAASGRSGITPDDRTYLTRLVAARTGVGEAEATRRTNDAINGAITAMQKVRRSAVILAFSVAVSLLAGVAAAWYGATVGGRRRDEA